MIVNLLTPSDDQRRLVQAALVGQRRPFEVSAILATDEADDQLTGREALQQRAQHRAARAVLHDLQAQAGLGLCVGIDLTPAGAFLVAVAALRLRSGREYVGWNEPRRIPEMIARDLHHGRTLATAVQTYRQQWRASDTISLNELQELASGEQSMSEALTSAFDAWG